MERMNEKGGGGRKGTNQGCGDRNKEEEKSNEMTGESEGECAR